MRFSFSKQNKPIQLWHVAESLLIGSAGLGSRLITSAVRHPSQQERQAFQQLQGLLQELAYAQQRDSDGNLTITVQAQPVS